MDLETDENLYVGKGRGIEDFRKFLALHGIVAFPKKQKNTQFLQTEYFT